MANPTNAMNKTILKRNNWRFKSILLYVIVLLLFGIVILALSHNFERKKGVGKIAGFFKEILKENFLFLGKRKRTVNRKRK